MRDSNARPMAPEVWQAFDSPSRCLTVPDAPSRISATTKELGASGLTWLHSPRLSRTPLLPRKWS